MLLLTNLANGGGGLPLIVENIRSTSVFIFHTKIKVTQKINLLTFYSSFGYKKYFYYTKSSES